MGIITIEIPGWTPTPLNKLMRGHWSNGSKAKARDRDTLGMCAMAYGLHEHKPARVKRRVDLTIIMPKGQRACDPDAHWKSLLDGLVHAGLLVNDSKEWCEPGQVTYAKGERLVTFVTLKDVF